MWFEAIDQGIIQFFTGPTTVKVRHLSRDPRASLVVAAPVGERERWLSVAGPTTVEPDGAHELVQRLAARYWDLGDAGRAADLADMLGGEWVRVVIRADTVSRYAM